MDSLRNTQDTTEGSVPVDRQAEGGVPFGRPVISRERQNLVPYNADPVNSESSIRRVRSRNA